MKKMYAFLLGILLTSTLLGCNLQGANNSSATESTFEKAKREGRVTVGFANEQPFAYATPDGTITGEAVEVARAILNNLGINEMNGVLTEFGSLIPGLKASRFDIITAGMFITPDRSKEVAFANPEYSIGEAIAVEQGNPHQINSYDDISKNKEIKVAVMVGAIEIEYLTKSGVSKDQITIVPDQPSAVSALQAGRVQVITMTGPSLQAMLESSKDSGIERVADFIQPEIDGKSVRGYGAAAFRIEDLDFREAFNAELEKLKQSGQLLEILKPFGFTEDELPGDMTASQLSEG